MTDINTFLEFAESLKLVRRANLEKEGKSIIEKIYTDLLPNNGVISKVNLPRTTIVVGRKGTGKSTIFYKSQMDLDKNGENITVYIDTKSLYDNSTPTLPEELDNTKHSKDLIKYLIYSNLLREIILRTKEKIKKRLNENRIISFLGLNEEKIELIHQELEDIQNSIDGVFKTLNISLTTICKNSAENSTEKEITASASANIENIGGSVESLNKHNNVFKREFENTLITYLDIKKCFIDNIIKIRDIIGVKKVFIYLDDFSEIDKEAQSLFIDWFIAPVNNLSEDFVKFKIATYPNRFYYGKLDNGKIDEISLDFFDAFYHYENDLNGTDISKMEYLALDYTKRLLKNRLDIYFPNNGWSGFFDISEEDLYHLLFKISMNMPRKIGYILSFCYESCLIHNKKITVAALENAALRYYTDIIEKYFIVNEFVCKPFDDRISEEHHYEMMRTIIDRELVNQKVIKRRKNNYTCMFVVNQEFSNLLSNLELNGFISTYNKIKENSNFYTVYCIDYGLCKKYQLKFGTPKNKDISNFLLQPLFNFNALVIEFLDSTQVIRCLNGHEFRYSEISQFKKYNMKCPICLENDSISNCKVVFKYTEIKKQFEEKEKNIRFTFVGYLIMDLLRKMQKALPLQKIGETLDYSTSTLQRHIRMLIAQNMIAIDKEPTQMLQKEFYILTKKGDTFLQRIERFLSERVNKESFMY